MPKLPPVTVPVAASVTIDLPKIAWNDATAIASYLTTIVLTATALLALIHPGFTVPSVVPEVVTPLASVIAGVVQIVNIVTHRNLQTAALAAAQRAS